MKKTVFLFPNQLFSAPFTQHAELNLVDTIVLIEDDLFFLDHQYPVNFHKKKLMLHRASMRAYAAQCEAQGYIVHYMNWENRVLEKSFKLFATNDSELILYDSVDFALNKRLKKLCLANKIKPTWLQSPLFINTNTENNVYRKTKQRWFMADFYKHQRRKLNVLLEDSEPIGGKWSFDEENRKKIPAKERVNIPKLSYPLETDWISEAREYVANTFPNALGEDENFEYPITHDQANKWLVVFLEQRFEKFGPYEDALVPQQSWLYHSVLTPMLNIGLLSPENIIRAALDYAKKHDVPIASTEGFVRQIIGWREFMRATYVDLGVSMRTTNHWQQTRKIPLSFYSGTTGIKPIDDVIKRVLTTGYCHHIERLMVLGGFMFLCEFDPDDIYRWFSELFIDAYDWVMVPNVYAMSQNADGGLITTKPYFSGSSYLKKMGYDDFNKQGGDWRDIWDGLYWRWIDKHQESLAKNPRWAMMCAMARKMDVEKMAKHKLNAEQFLSLLND